MTQEEIETYQQMIINHERALLKRSNKTWSLIQKNNKLEIQYDNAQALIDVFSNLITASEKNFFVENLIDTLNNDIEQSINTSTNRHIPEIHYLSAAQLCFFTLLQLGYIDDAIDGYQSHLYGKYSYNLFLLVSDILRENYNYFTIMQLNLLCKNLETIENTIGYLNSIVYQVRIKITTQGMEILKNEIKGVNIEINRDKESVINKINTLHLDKKYVLFLNQLDEYLNNSDQIIASGMISNFRSFWEQLLIDFAYEICKKKSISFPNNGLSSISNARTIIKEHLVLSDKDNSLISRYVDVLHENGGHAFIANKEYLRLSRNIGIEILLLLLYKIEEI